jgi:hypothetical protein
MLITMTEWPLVPNTLHLSNKFSASFTELGQGLYVAYMFIHSLSFPYIHILVEYQGCGNYHSFIFVKKNICRRFKYIHFSIGKYKNCSCLTNLHAETLAARGATLLPLKVQTGVAVKKQTQKKNTAAEGLTVREGCVS